MYDPQIQLDNLFKNNYFSVIPAMISAMCLKSEKHVEFPWFCAAQLPLRF